MEEIAKEGFRLLFSQGGLLGLVTAALTWFAWFLLKQLKDRDDKIASLQQARVDDHKTLASEAIKTMQTISTTAATQAVATENNTRVIQERNRAFETVAVGIESLSDKVERLAGDFLRFVDRGGAR